MSKETYAMKDGQTESVKEEYSKCSLDLETGELVEYMADEDGYLPYMHGVWGDVAVFQDWYADRPDGTPVKRDGSEDYTFRLYSKNLRTGEEKTIVDVTENFIWTADPHVSWGQYTVYQVDRSVYVYDMETQTSKKLFTHEPGWDFYNYMIQDGHVMVIVERRIPAAHGQSILWMGLSLSWTPTAKMWWHFLHIMSATATSSVFCMLRITLISITSARRTITEAIMTRRSADRAQ